MRSSSVRILTSAWGTNGSITKWRSFPVARPTFKIEEMGLTRCPAVAIGRKSQWRGTMRDFSLEHPCWCAAQSIAGPLPGWHSPWWVPACRDAWSADQVWPLVSVQIKKGNCQGQNWWRVRTLRTGIHLRLQPRFFLDELLPRGVLVEDGQATFLEAVTLGVGQMAADEPFARGFPNGSSRHGVRCALPRSARSRQKNLEVKVKASTLSIADGRQTCRCQGNACNGGRSFSRVDFFVTRRGDIGDHRSQTQTPK